MGATIQSPNYQGSPSLFSRGINGSSLENISITSAGDHNQTIYIDNENPSRLWIHTTQRGEERACETRQGSSSSDLVTELSKALFHAISGIIFAGAIFLIASFIPSIYLLDIGNLPPLFRYISIWSILFSIFLVIAVFLGMYIFVSKSGHVPPFAYIALVLVLILCTIIFGIVMEHNLSRNVKALLNLWDHLSDSTKNVLQYNGDCCGLSSPLDAPGGACFGIVGCVQRVDLISTSFRYHYQKFVVIICTLGFTELLLTFIIKTNKLL